LKRKGAPSGRRLRFGGALPPAGDLARTPVRRFQLLGDPQGGKGHVRDGRENVDLTEVFLLRRRPLWRQEKKIEDNY
jgi:hypothetical protein